MKLSRKIIQEKYFATKYRVSVFENPKLRYLFLGGNEKVSVRKCLKHWLRECVCMHDHSDVCITFILLQCDPNKTI